MIIIVFLKTHQVSKFLVSPISQVYIIRSYHNFSEPKLQDTFDSIKNQKILLSNRTPYYLELSELLYYSMILYYSKSLLKPVSLISILSLWFYITIYCMGLFSTRVVQHL